eukprot:3659999-Lingulodinium_polyedra.AAC.1
MRTRQPTWGREHAEKEAFYVHPLTRTTLSFAMRAHEDMPTMVGVPRDAVTPTLPQEQPTYG